MDAVDISPVVLSGKPPPREYRPQPPQSKHETSSDPELGGKPPKGKGRRSSHRQSLRASSAASDVSLAESDASTLGMTPPPKEQLYIARLLMSLLATSLLWATSLNVVTSVVQLDS